MLITSSTNSQTQLQVSENEFVLSPVFWGGLAKHLKDQLPWFIFYYLAILPLNAILPLHVTPLGCNGAPLNQREPLSRISERSLVACGWRMTACSVEGAHLGLGSNLAGWGQKVTTLFISWSRCPLNPGSLQGSSRWRQGRLESAQTSWQLQSDVASPRPERVTRSPSRELCGNVQWDYPVPSKSHVGERERCFWITWACVQFRSEFSHYVRAALPFSKLFKLCLNIYGC